MNKEVIVMNKWKDNDLEKIEIKIKIPKNTIAFIVNTISQEKNKISMSNTQYDSNDVEKLKNRFSRTGTLTNEVLYEENTKLINQQKEFIEYMDKTIEELECDDVDDEEMKAYLIQRIDIFKEILSKYKEIIGYRH